MSGVCANAAPNMAKTPSANKAIRFIVTPFGINRVPSNIPHCPVGEADADEGHELRLVSRVERLRGVTKRIKVDAAMHVPQAVVAPSTDRYLRVRPEAEEPEGVIFARQLVIVAETQSDSDRKKHVGRLADPARGGAKLEICPGELSIVRLTEPRMGIQLKGDERVRREECVGGIGRSDFEPELLPVAERAVRTGVRRVCRARGVVIGQRIREGGVEIAFVPEAVRGPVGASQSCI